MHRIYPPERGQWTLPSSLDKGEGQPGQGWTAPVHWLNKVTSNSLAAWIVSAASTAASATIQSRTRSMDSHRHSNILLPQPPANRGWSLGGCASSRVWRVSDWGPHLPRPKEGPWVSDHVPFAGIRLGRSPPAAVLSGMHSPKTNYF